MNERTRVDLGDDLLESSAELGHDPVLEPSFSGTFNIDDQLHSAKILFGEGLLEEAKKILRKILLMDPERLAARRMLDEIHELELKQIFSEAPMIRGARQGSGATDSEFYSIDSEKVMRDLDRDLKLGVFGEGDAGEALVAELSLFQSREAMQDFAEKLDQDFAGYPSQDRMDIGIAFLEMGLYDLAARQFEAATRDSERIAIATSLLSYALIMAGRAFEATLRLEQVLGDSELRPEDRLELMYLMARAHEKLGKSQSAMQWYLEVARANPQYRTVQERLKILTIAERGTGHPQR